MSKSTWARGLAAASVLVIAVAGPVLGGETRDEVMIPGEKLEALLSPNGETKLIAVAGVGGSRMSIVVKAPRGSGVQPALTVLDPSGRKIDLVDEGRVSSRKAQVKKLSLGLTGIWRVAVRTPRGAGGTFSLTVKAKPPKKFDFPGELLDAAQVLDRPFDALPDSRLKFKVSRKGKPKFTPTMQIISPSGEVLADTAIETPKKGIVLPELGTYTARVTGGPGSFKAILRVKPPNGKTRKPLYADVEALPGVDDLVTRFVENAGTRELRLSGFAFSTDNTVSISNEELETVVSGSVFSASETGARVSLVLDETPAGEYTVQVGTTSGKALQLRDPITVTNKIPVIGTFEPDGLAWRERAPLRLRGGGLDPDVQISLRRVEDGTPGTVEVVDRISHALVDVEVSVPRFAVGPYDVTTSDPSGGSHVHPGALDILGFRRGVTTIHDAPDTSASDYGPMDAAWADTEGLVLVAVRTANDDAAFVLYDSDTDTVAVEDTFPAGVRELPRVAWNPRDRTWATCWRSYSGNLSQIVVNIHSTDFRSILATRTAFGQSDYSGFAIAANPDDGGFMLAVVQQAGATSKLRTRLIDSAGTLSGGATVEETDSPGFIAFPAIAYVGSDKFVIAYSGTGIGAGRLAIRRVVIHDDGSLSLASAAASSDINWIAIDQPELAVNPHDGRVTVAFTTVDSDFDFHPAAFQLEGDQYISTRLFDLGAGDSLPFGFVTSLVWNEERNEFIIAMTAQNGFFSAVILRRLTPEGFIKSTSLLHAYQGDRGVLYGGEREKTLGLVILGDASISGNYEGLPPLYTLIGPIR